MLTPNAGPAGTRKTAAGGWSQSDFGSSQGFPQPAGRKCLSKPPVPPGQATTGMWRDDFPVPSTWGPIPFLFDSGWAFTGTHLQWQQDVYFLLVVLGLICDGSGKVVGSGDGPYKDVLTIVLH